MKATKPFLFSILFICFFSFDSFCQKNPDKFIAIGLQAESEWLYQDNPRFPISNTVGIFYQNYLFSNWSISLSISFAQRRYNSFSRIYFQGNQGPTILSNNIFMEKSMNLKAAVKYYIHTSHASYFASVGTIRKRGFRSRGEIFSTYLPDTATPINNPKTEIDLGFDVGLGVEFDAFENIMMAVKIGSLLFLNQDRGTTRHINFYTEMKKGGINNFYLQLQMGYAFGFPKKLEKLK